MTDTSQDSAPQARPPTPLTVALSLTAVEALVFAVLAVAELVAFDPAKGAVAATTAAFFVVYGGGLALCAWALWRLRSWARAPVVLAQLIQLLVAWSFWGGETTWVAVALAAVAVVVLAGIFHPASIEALAED